MFDTLSLVPVVLGQAIMPQRLKRTPEPEVMNQAESVAQYNHALQSKLSIVYAGALLKIHQLRRTKGGRVVDLCCGPGHFTLQLAKYFDFEEVIGVDLSPGMIEIAKENAAQWGLGNRVRFVQGDALATQLEDKAFNIVTCNDAAHHMPSLNSIRKLLTEMDRLATDKGLVLLTDLVRLKNQWITDRYTRAIGRDYVARRLLAFQQDFCNSMQAAWLPSELSSACPKEMSRHWKLVTQRVLPTVQFILGLPEDTKKATLGRGEPWSIDEHPVPASLRNEWRLFRMLV